MKTKEILKHPATLVSALLGGLGLAVKPALVLGVGGALWGQLGTLFTAISVFAFTVVPQVPALSPAESILTGAALLTGVAYGLKLLNRVYQRIQTQL